MKYQVTFHYQTVLDAECESDAEDMAWETFFREITSLNAKDFVSTVDEMEA
jgi:hypothetical protein